MIEKKEEKFQRVNVLLHREQYDRVNEAGLNMSGLIRGLLDDHFSEEKIVFSVSPKVKAVYQNIISNFGGEDKDLEAYFLKALDQFLADKTQQIASLRKSIQT
jgi:esterase/lipase